MLDDAFGRLGQTAVIAGVVPHNLPSMRVMERLGFARGPVVTSGAHTYAVFTLARERWEAAPERRREA